jgi:hypothetical protein
MFRFGHFLNLNLNFALSSNLNAEPNFEINTDQGSDLLPSPTLAGLWARDLYFLLPRVLVIPSLGTLRSNLRSRWAGDFSANNLYS